MLSSEPLSHSGVLQTTLAEYITLHLFIIMFVTYYIHVIFVDRRQNIETTTSSHNCNFTSKVTSHYIPVKL